MPSQESRLHDALATGRNGLVDVLSWLAFVFGASLTLSLRFARGVWRWLRSLTTQFVGGTRRVLTGPVRQTLAGPVRVGLLGRRSDVSLLVVVLAPLLALATAWWFGTAVGFETLETWVRGTWYGTDPQLVVFLLVAVLLALGTVSAALNSGLVPTTLLVAAPVFGAVVTRYGTTVTRGGDAVVVSLPNAVGVAAAVALLVGAVLGVCSFLLGVALRRLADVFRRDAGPSSPVEQPE